MFCYAKALLRIELLNPYFKLLKTVRMGSKAEVQHYLSADGQIFLEHLLLFGQDIRLKCFTGLKLFVCVKMNTLPGV